MGSLPKTIEFVNGSGSADNGKFDIVNGNELRISEAADRGEQANYQIRVRVSNNQGQHTANFSITVTEVDNTAPVLSPIGNRQINEENLLSFTAGASDEDNDDLSYGLDASP